MVREKKKGLNNIQRENSMLRTKKKKFEPNQTEIYANKKQILNKE